VHGLPPPAGEALATRTAAVEPSISAPLARLPAYVAPPVQFGRLTQGVSDLSAEGPQQGCLGVLCWCPRSATDLAPCRWYWMTLVAAARSLRNHMEPADLMELIVILAEAAADVVRKRGNGAVDACATATCRFRECSTDTMGASGCG
jgi:hypothetical protein